MECRCAQAITTTFAVPRSATGRPKEFMDSVVGFLEGYKATGKLLRILTKKTKTTKTKLFLLFFFANATVLFWAWVVVLPSEHAATKDTP